MAVSPHLCERVKPPLRLLLVLEAEGEVAVLVPLQLE